MVRGTGMYDDLARWRVLVANRCSNGRLFSTTPRWCCKGQQWSVAGGGGGGAGGGGGRVVIGE